MCLSKTDMFGKDASFFKKQKEPAASLFSRKQGLGVPIHIEIQFIWIHIPFILINIYIYIYILIYPIVIININYIDCLLIAYLLGTYIKRNRNQMGQTKGPFDFLETSRYRI